MGLILSASSFLIFVILYHKTEEYLKERGIKRGRNPKYVGRVDIQNPDGRFLEKVKIEGTKSEWTGIVYSQALERDIRIVIVKEYKTTVVFFSTNTDMKAENITSIYRKRFQIEFGIPNSRQFTGLHHSLARDAKRLDFAFNVSFLLETCF